jgi:hypothetical protein
MLSRRQGNHAEAAVMAKQALAGFEERFGQEHVSTMKAKFQLALLYCNLTDKLQAARMLLEELIPRVTKILGHDNTTTRKVIQALGALYSQKLNMLSEAKELFKQNIMRCEKVLGPKHRATLSAVHD